MATSIKISQLPAKGANLEATDLLEVSEFNGTGYVSKSITGAEIIDSIPSASVAWGDITGTLSAQTDLNTELSGKVPTTRTLTINGTTQDLSADRTFTISTGITIGTTSITSGTVGRVLFEGTGNVVQESANLFWDNTNGRLGIAQSTPTARIHIQGSTALTSSSSLVIFNSTPTEIFRVRDNGNVQIGATTDAGYKLDVNGTARIQGVVETTQHAYLNNGVWCDVYKNRFGAEVFRITLTSNNMLIGTTTDVSSSLVTMNSTTKGFLPPRMTTTQKNAIASPATGLMVYDTTLNLISVYNGTIWISL